MVLVQNEEKLCNEDKNSEILRNNITMGLKDIEEGRTLSLEVYLNKKWVC